MTSRILAIYLIDTSGLLIGSRTDEGLTTADADLLVAHIEMIMRFLHSSRSVTEGGWLSSIGSQDLNLAVEKGEHSYLVVSFQGDEPPGLRRTMRSALRGFERLNLGVLEEGPGTTDRWIGLDDILARTLRRLRGSPRRFISGLRTERKGL